MPGTPTRWLTVTVAAALVAGAALVGVAPAAATPIVVPSARIVTHNAAGDKGNNSSFAMYATPDLDQLFIGSQANNLVPSAQNAEYALHYYIADTAADSLTQWDLDAQGHGVTPQLQIKTVSKDLRFVLYTRTLPDGTPRDELVDRTTGGVTLNPCGAYYQFCSHPTITLDDRYLIFNTVNLGSYNVAIGDYVLATYEIATGQVVLRAAPSIPERNSTSVQIGFNMKAGPGDWFYYNTGNKGLTGDPTGKSHIVRENLVSGVIEVMDKTSSGVIGNRDANDYNISPDGQFMTFNTLSTNFAAGDADGQWRPYLKNIATGALTPLARLGSGPDYVTSAGNYQASLGAFTADNSLLLCTRDPGMVPQGTGSILRSPDGTLRWFSKHCSLGISTDGKTYVYLGEPDDEPDYVGQQVYIAPVTFPSPADAVAPLVTGTPDRQPNANGWSPLGTVVTWSATDPAPSSGAATVPAATTVVTEGALQEVMSGQSCDPVGNCATGTYAISVDASAPALTSQALQLPNAAGWYRGDVTFHWTCSDALSGIQGACPSDSTITGEGAGLVIASTVSDRAGNTTTASTTSVKVDRTAPVTAANAPSGWTNHAVTVSLSASDNLSGVATTSFSVDGGAFQTGTSATISGEGVHTLAYRSTDTAGNVESTRTSQIRLDYSGPTLTATLSPAANSAGWNSSVVTVSTACTDSLSGIASCSAPTTVGSNGRNQLVTISGTDNAGNTSSRAVTVNIDTVKPVVRLNGPANGADYALNAAPSASCSTSDALSGVSVAAILTTTRNASGTYTSTCSGARDAAGNAGIAVSVTYDVSPTYVSLLALSYQYLDADNSPHPIAKLTLALTLALPGCSFLAEVRVLAQAHAITSAQADELIYWAKILKPGCA